MEDELSLNNDLAELNRLSQWIHRFGRSLGLAEAEIFNLDLALEEIVTNVMKYAYGPGVEQLIEVRAWFKDGVLTLMVEDSGDRFDPLEAERPSQPHELADMAVGGLGIFLTRQIMDEMSYARRKGRNILTMIKRFGPAVGLTPARR